MISLKGFTQFLPSLNTQFRDALYYPGQTCANIWGYVDSLGNEYALLGVQTGTAIINVTNPDDIFQVAFIPNPDNLWKEIKTWDKYAYVTTEGGGGLQIIDLSNLPGTNLPYTTWQPVVPGQSSNCTVNTIHALHIDAGKVYLYGSNCANGGVVIGDLSNPMQPTYLGRYNEFYVHDGIVRNDTIYAAQILAGNARILNASDPQNITVMGQVTTPTAFTHNTWLSDDSKYMFTTDENQNSFLAAYDIQDLENITLLDRINSTNGSGVIVHNTYYHNGYAVTSWYKDGFTIVDASRPHNLVTVGRYDTYRGSGSGFNGAWGVYPYLPSGNILVSNMDTAVSSASADAGGLIVVTPNYVRGCYLEGLVKDSVTNLPLFGAQVSIQGIDSDLSDENGSYAIGSAIGGSYNISVSKIGYQTYTASGIQLTNGELVIRDILMVPDFSSLTTFKLADVIKIFPNPSNGNLTLSGFIHGEKYNLEILDLSGKLLIHKNISSSNTNIYLETGLSSGCYFLKIANEYENITKKIVIE